MSLTPGTRLGPYEIVAPIGAGGMGEVYRAKDTRLGRDVAIKVLPQHLSANPEVRARFEREAKTVSSLNHPNICTLFDVGREGETDFLVMELIEGETLATRVQRGPLPAPELLRLGVQIAEALDRAHRAGVIHRDLKPGNIMITRSGAKLMDFGLSRATGLAGSAAGSSAAMTALSQSPTMAQALTAEGTILGTFQYMSPEQLEGRESDARSDIWALGCVLYEMATGRRAFEGRSQASLIAAILERQPPSVGEAPSGSGAITAGGPPAGLDGLIRDCLNKDPHERMQTAHEVKLRLQHIGESAGFSTSGVSAVVPPASTPAAPAVAPRSRAGGAAVAWAVAAVAVIAAGVFAAWAWPRLNAPHPVYRFKPETEFAGGQDPHWPRISPDGHMLAFEAQDSSGIARAWVLRLDETTARPISGTEKLSRAYWSPDGKEIAFVADGKIQRVSIAGGSPTIVCPAPGGSDLSWGAKGMILMDGRFTDSLKVVSASGGDLHPATRIYREDHENGSGWPCFLPDGEHFLFIGNRSDGGAGNIRLGKLGTLDSKLLGRADGRVEIGPDGWVLFVRGSSLVAQRLDVGAAKMLGDPITLADDLRIGTASGHFSVSRDGVLAFQRGQATSAVSLEIVDRKGNTVTRTPVSGTVANPSFSPDAHRLLYERKGAGGSPWGDISVYDLDRGTDTPLSFTGGTALRVAWSPDGRRIAYSRLSPVGGPKLMIGSSDGLGAPDSIAVPQPFYLMQWTAAGDRLVGFDDGGHALVVDATGSDRVVRPLVDSTQVLAHPRVSPDGRWLAGVVGNPSSFHVFVQTLQGPPGRWQISSGTSASDPHWTRGGKELVYESLDGRIMAVEIDTRAGFHAGVPRELFTLATPSNSISIRNWTVDDTGERFVVLRTPRVSGPARTIEIVTDLRALVERK